MFAWKTYAGIAAVAFGALAAGCGSVGDFGMGGTKSAALGAKTPQQSADMPERPKLVMPAPNAPLPVPGEGGPTPAAWVPTVQQPARQAAVTPVSQPAAAAQPQQQESGSWYSGITGVFR